MFPQQHQLRRQPTQTQPCSSWPHHAPNMLWSSSKVRQRPQQHRAHRPQPQRRARQIATAAAASADEPSVAIQFVTPEQQQPIEVQCPSGEQLRACMLENKVDLYTTWGKIWSCGGAGQCGTCIVQVQEDAGGLLSERSATEDKKLRGKPGSWRLACQTIVGDGERSGRLVIQTKPQSK